MKIFIEAEKRISMVVSSSACLSDLVLSAGIDKLDGKLKHAVSTDYVLSRLNEFSLKYRLAQLNNSRSSYLEVLFGAQSFHLQLSFDKKFVTNIASNPNKFLSWPNYLDSLNLALGDSHAEIIPTRTDLNIDYALDIKTLIASIDFKNKKKETNFSSDKGDRTGIVVGKGDETIKVYGKDQDEASGEFKRSRVEKKLTGDKLPARNILELPKLLLENSYFDNVIGLNLEFTSSYLNEEQSDRLKEFKIILSREGFFNAKKNFNKNHNFDRDFKNLLNMTLWKNQPNELFKKHISVFLNEAKDNTWTH